MPGPSSALRPLLLLTLALGALPASALAGPRRPQAKPAAKPIAKAGRVSLKQLRKVNPGATVKRIRPSRAQLERAVPAAPEQPQLPSVAKPVSRAALAAELHVPQGSLGGPQVVGFARAAFTTPSGMGVSMSVAGADAVWRSEKGLLANWTYRPLPGEWPDYYKPFGLQLTLEDVPPNRQVVLKCEFTVFNDSTVRLNEYPGGRWKSEAVSMTLESAASDEPWGARTVNVTYVTTALPQTAPRHIYIAAEQFTFYDRGCTIAELDA